METGLLPYLKELDLGSAWKAYTEMQYCFSAKDIEFIICQLKVLKNTKIFIDLEKNRYLTLTHLRPESLLKIVCSDIMLSKEGSIAIDFNSLNSTSLNQYVSSLKHRAQVYHEVYPFEEIPLDLQHPLNSFWWENNTPEKHNHSSGYLEKLSQYFYDICIPQRLGGVIFKEPTIWSYPDALIHMDHHASEPLGLRPDKILNGDEFEYWAGGALYQGKDDRIRELLHRLDLHARKVAETINVAEKDFTTTCDLYPDDYERRMYRGKPRLTIRFGAWRCVAHWDYWSQEPLFEINASPYKIDEQYIINGRKFTVYEIYDLFITSFARQEGLKSSSGHKHIDFHESIGGNPEFLFRLFVSAEQNSFLSHVFKTEEYSDSSNQYVSQSKENLCKIRALQSMVKGFNDWIRLGHTGKSGDHFSVNECFRHLWSGLFASSGSKYAPIGMRELTPLGMKPEASLGIPCLPRNTLEFRFFNCARSGKEVKQINTLLGAWLSCINKAQKERTFVEEYLPYDPLSMSMSESQVKEKFRLFLSCIGVDSSEFNELFW